MNKNPALVIALSFLTPILLGGFLLWFPFSHIGELGFLDALFTSASAITVTGLSVVDTATRFTLIGKSIILLLIQLGGLGFMTFSTLTLILLGRSLSLTDRMLIESGFTTGGYRNLYPLIKRIFLFTVSFELVGALVLFFSLRIANPMERAFFAIFHSVSAFCNAGFSTFGNSLEDYAANWLVNGTFMVLIVSGGIGFLVLNEMGHIIRKRRALSKMSLHSKMALTTSAYLLLAGTLVLFVFESHGQALPQRLLTSLFHSVTSRTAGFNTVNLALYSQATLMFICLLMFIGASPGSTGGGIKTTTAATTFAYLRSYVMGRKRTEMKYRSLPEKTVEKAFLLIILALVLVVVIQFLLLIFEPNLRFFSLLFEVISAFGTVGLSLGITSALGSAAKILLMITMFIGRIGPMTLLLALSRDESRAIITYPEEDVMIG
jgi:trk system potassium uptake protein TrkH